MYAVLMPRHGPVCAGRRAQALVDAVAKRGEFRWRSQPGAGLCLLPLCPPPAPGWPHFSVDTELGAPECLLVSAAASGPWRRAKAGSAGTGCMSCRWTLCRGKRAAAERGGLQLTCCLSAGLFCAHKQGLPGAPRPCAGRRSRACPFLLLLYSRLTQLCTL